MMPLATLPVALTNFSAQAVGKQTALLNWATTRELNSSHFSVERSTDGRAFLLTLTGVLR